MVIRVSDKKKNYSKVTKLLVKPKYYTYLPGRNLYVKRVEEDKEKKEPTLEEEKDYAIKYVNNVLSLIKRRNDKMYLDLIK